MTILIVVVLLNFNISRVSYACPKFASKSHATAVNLVFGILRVLYSMLWMDFVCMWFKVSLAIIFQLNPGANGNGKDIRVSFGLTCILKLHLIL